MLRHRIAIALLACAALLVLVAPAQAQARDDSHIGRLSLGLATASGPHDTFLYDASVVAGYGGPRFDLAVAFGGASALLASGARGMVQVAPEAGYHIGWRDAEREAIIRLYGAVRLPYQTRAGAGLPSEHGAAISAEVGVRLWACGSSDDPYLGEGICTGLSVGARYQRHLTDFQVGPAVLPAKSSVLTFPITIDFGINASSL